MLLQQKSAQMGNNLAEQQVNINNNKAKTKHQTEEQLSSPLSQVPKTYDFGNFDNCGLNSEIILIYHQLHSHLYHVCRNLHKRASGPDPFTSERDLPLQMGAHW